VRRAIQRALLPGVPTTLSFVHFPSFAAIPVKAVMAYAGEECTSQLSKIKHRPAVTDLSGGKTSAESFTPRRSNLAVSDAVDFQFCLLSFAAAFGSALLLERLSSDA